jgi:hypothetical protein
MDEAQKGLVGAKERKAAREKGACVPAWADFA